jgi:hypothetical protein
MSGTKSRQEQRAKVLTIYRDRYLTKNGRFVCLQTSGDTPPICQTLHCHQVNAVNAVNAAQVCSGQVAYLAQVEARLQQQPPVSSRCCQCKWPPAHWKHVAIVAVCRCHIQPRLSGPFQDPLRASASLRSCATAFPTWLRPLQLLESFDLPWYISDGCVFSFSLLASSCFRPKNCRMASAESSPEPIAPFASKQHLPAFLVGKYSISYIQELYWIGTIYSNKTDNVLACSRTNEDGKLLHQRKACLSHDCCSGFHLVQLLSICPIRLRHLCLL